jgi:glycosyltransferase involved in cell wall biosynthesis
MRPLRVAHMLGSAVAGGAERQELALARLLPKERFQVEFLVIGSHLDYQSRLEAEGIRARFLRAPSPPQETLLGGAWRRSQMAARFVPTVRGGRYDIVDAWLYPADVLAATTRWLTGAPVVMSGRRNIHPHDRFGPLAGAVDAVVARLTDAVVANSTAAADHAVRTQRTDRGKLRIIRNGVELAVPMSASERSTWRRTFAVPDDAIVIGCVGNYRSVKRHQLLVEAFASLSRDHPDLRLVLVGEGETRVALERQIGSLGLESVIRLHGPLPDAREAYGAFDIVAQASRSEGLPNVLLEAAAAGRAIVATAAGGSGEVVVDGDTGLLIPIEDVAALTAALRRLVEDGELRQRLGAAARLHVEETFGMGRFVREYGDLYEEMAALKGVRR